MNEVRKYIATLVANHGTGNVEDVDPDPDDYRLAEHIINILTPRHGYHTLGRRLVGVLIIGVLALILIVTAWSAQ